MTYCAKMSGVRDRLRRSNFAELDAMLDLTTPTGGTTTWKSDGSEPCIPRPPAVNAIGISIRKNGAAERPLPLIHSARAPYGVCFLLFATSILRGRPRFRSPDGTILSGRVRGRPEDVTTISSGNQWLMEIARLTGGIPLDNHNSAVNLSTGPWLSERMRRLTSW